ncbi:signal peptidase I [Cellulomonas sp. PSBB021]|uniref:signal peptidase I n=1 Tax=Cellulomonas sp. PSBB021 TaxID=2003551 RepID=UPI000B8DB1EC|nr:signal peptidase I [Cellulomonas sp. PSBB021]ASR55275.1 signal peptidase I [Cellulomonas sp. PSBB021]
MTARRHDSALSGVLAVLMWAVLLVVVAAVAVLVVVPKALGGTTLTVLTGSMEPTFSPGDVVAVRTVTDPATEVHVGDVVTFQPVSGDPTLVTHRVVAKRISAAGTTFVTRGDANGADDDPIEPAQIQAVAVYSVPWVGHVSLWLGERKGLAVALVAAALLGYAAVMILRPERRTRDDEPTADTPADTPADVPTDVPTDDERARAGEVEGAR